MQRLWILFPREDLEMANKHKLTQRKNLFIFFMVLPAVILPMIFTY